MRYFIIGGIVDTDASIREINRLQQICRIIGETLRELGHSIVICSPFQDSADYWVYKGFIQAKQPINNEVEIHYVDTPSVNMEVDALISLYTGNQRQVRKISHNSPSSDDYEALKYAWLLCQLNALESSQVVIAVGGKLNGAANMLLLLAESKRKKLFPFSFMNGAAEQSFQRNRYQLKDILGNEYGILQNEQSIKAAIELIHKQIHNPNDIAVRNPLSVFISYPRARPCEADYVETLLRRRHINVFRDDSDFSTGHEIQKMITEAIYGANVFIALWCAEYACSPWCFDEMELALERNRDNKMKLWILRVDDTRIVPKGARDLLCHDVKTREALEGQLLSLIEESEKAIQ